MKYRLIYSDGNCLYDTHIDSRSDRKAILRAVDFVYNGFFNGLELSKEDMSTAENLVEAIQWRIKRIEDHWGRMDATIYALINPKQNVNLFGSCDESIYK